MAPVPWLRRPSANVGKSTVGLALTKLFTQPTIGNDQIDADDYPYNNIGPMTIEGVLGFLPSEVNRVLPQTASEAQKLRQWLLEGKEVTLTLIRPQQSDQDKAVLRWTKGLSATPSELTDIGRFALSRYKVLHEFRARSAIDARSKAVESSTGLDTASVLLNLKNHSDPYERARYRKIVESFKVLFPRYDIEAVERQPGTGIPDVQFWEDGRPSAISLSRISSGVHQILTLLLNLIAREGLVIFLEHPEQHLHPHSMRFLHSLLWAAAEYNQIIIVTHDPHFVVWKQDHCKNSAWRRQRAGN